VTEPKIVDCRGQGCPQPVINTKAALEEAGGPLVVIVDNEAARDNVTRFAESKGARVTVAQRDGDYHLTLEPGQTAPAAEEPPVCCELPGPGQSIGQSVVCVSSEGMGRGDEELGGILMAAFLDTLSQFKGKISHAIFLNAGAKLAIEGSPVLDQIRQLEQVGVEVLVCGTCLNHFGIQDRLAVGRVSNMFAIIEVLSSAGRVIRP
jgi:selenium metabolism protein YedF